MRRRLLIVHNALAGTRSRSFLRSVCRHLQDMGAEVSTEHAEHIEQDQEVARAAALSGLYDAVVAAGGDSTIRGVASGLIGSTIPLGIIPIGTGNVLAREIGCRLEAKALADYLVQGPSVQIKCGLADGTPFLAMAGIGFDADVLLRLSTTWKRSVGRAAYAWPVTRELFRKPQPFEVRVDDNQWLPATWVIGTRTAHYGGSFVIAKDQSLAADGFHAVIANTRSRRARAALLVSIALGRHESRPDVKIVPCSRLTIRENASVAAQIDGERIASTPAEITLSQERLTLIVPRGSPLAREGAITARASAPSR